MAKTVEIDGGYKFEPFDVERANKERELYREQSKRIVQKQQKKKKKKENA